jgi:hypothetical protein
LEEDRAVFGVDDYQVTVFMWLGGIFGISITEANFRDKQNPQIINAKGSVLVNVY